MNKNKFIFELIQKFDLIDGTLNQIELSKNSVSGLYLFEANNSSKKYYFYGIESGSLDKNFNNIDIVLESSGTEIKPQDTYLILFYEIEKDTPEKIKEIIPVEENEFRFKKYVFYYTKEELESIRENVSTFSKNKFWENKLPKGFDKLSINFLQRLVVKVPIIKLNFETKEMKQFDFFLNEKVEKSKMPDKKDIKQLDDQIEQYLQQGISTEKIVDSLIIDMYGGNINEYITE